MATHDTSRMQTLAGWQLDRSANSPDPTVPSRKVIAYLTAVNAVQFLATLAFWALGYAVVTRQFARPDEHSAAYSKLPSDDTDAMEMTTTDTKLDAHAPTAEVSASVRKRGQISMFTCIGVVGLAWFFYILSRITR